MSSVSSFLFSSFESCHQYERELRGKIIENLKTSAKGMSDVNMTIGEVLLKTGELLDDGVDEFTREFKQKYEEDPRLIHIIQTIVEGNKYYFYKELYSQETLQNILRGKM